MLNRRHVLLAPLVLLVACGSNHAPADPIWGKQPCAHCRMLVSDPRFAAQARTARGESLYFDDVGCLLSYLAEHPSSRASWVRDGSGQWLEAKRARYRAGAATPMDFGFIVDPKGTLDLAAVQSAVARRAERRTS